MIEKQTVIDKIEVLEMGHIQVRRATYILEDGVRIAGPSYHRVAYEPGMDVTTEAPRVKAIASTVWTPEVVAAFKEARRAK